MSQVMPIEPVDVEEGHADCPRCRELVWFFRGSLDADHDCPAAGRPVVIERCDCVDGFIKEHIGGCGHFCGCHPCEQCSGTCYIAHIVQGPPLPTDSEHPFNAPPVDDFDRTTTPIAGLELLDRAIEARDRIFDSMGIPADVMAQAPERDPEDRRRK